VKAELRLIRKNILILVFINMLFLMAAYVADRTARFNFHPGDIAILSVVFSFIALITILIFLKGQSREPDSQTFHSLVAITLKFLLEIIFALIWFVALKKNSFQFILIFFVLYLCLSLFSIGVILKTLKNKVL
jgi:hypothetical protein